MQNYVTSIYRKIILTDHLLMKKFALHIAATLFCALAIMTVLDWLVSYQLRKSASYAIKELPVWNDLFNGNAACDIAIYGNSRAWVHIDPKIVGDRFGSTAYNFGINGLNFPLQHFRHELLMAHSGQPKIIVHAVDEFLFERPQGLHNPEQFYPYMLWNREIQTHTRTYQGFSFPDFALPYFRYRGKPEAAKHAVSLLVAPDRNTIQRVNGYQGQDLEMPVDWERKAAAIPRYDIDVDTAIVRNFEAYLDDCKKRRIEIALVYTPQYYKGRGIVRNREKIRQMLATLAAKHGVPYLDFGHDPICYDRSLFYNSLHLNRKGATKFSRELCDRLLHQARIAAAPGIKRSFGSH